MQGSMPTIEHQLSYKPQQLSKQGSMPTIEHEDDILYVVLPLHVCLF